MASPFVITVADLGSAGYRVSAEFDGATRVEMLPCDLPLIKRNEREQALRWMAEARLDPDFVRDFGARLFRSLIFGAVEQRYREALRGLAPRDSVRLVLRLPASLAGLPWELMRDPSGSQGFVSRSLRSPMTRHFDDLPLPNAPPATAPLRALIACASPQEFSAVSDERELDAIQRALSPKSVALASALSSAWRRLAAGRRLVDAWRGLGREGWVTTDFLPHATRDRLQQALAVREYHIVHFIGHGEADEDGSRIFLERDDGTADSVPADEFAEMVGGPTVGLVVLNACQSAAALELFNGAAHEVLRRGVPAVIGTQAPILDRNAIEFARAFYESWASGETLERALAYARRLIRSGGGGEAGNWGVPVLYAGPQNTLQLSLETPPPARVWRVGKAVAAALAFVIITGIPTVAFYRSLLPPAPRVMTRLFNVVVADVGEITDATRGASTESADGAWLAQTMADELVVRLESSPVLKAKVDVQHEHIGFIPGTTADQRHAAAAKLAADLNADVVVYGFIDKTRLPPRFAPEFYVSPRLTGAEEATGPAAFGSAMRLALPLRNRPENAVALTAEFIPRAAALTDFMLGMAYLKAGLPEPAMARLEAARAVPQWADRQGKEILYLWIGTAQLARGDPNEAAETSRCAELTRHVRALVTDTARLAEGATYSECAQNAYEMARALNPNFARAYIGLGKVWIDRADARLSSTGKVACSVYERAAGLTERAQAPGVQSERAAFAPLKASFNIGVAYANGFVAGCDGPTPGRFFDEGTRALRAADAEFRRLDSPPPVALDLGARASFQLGRMLYAAGRYQDAMSALSEAERLAQPAREEDEEAWQGVRWNAALLRAEALRVTAAEAGDAGTSALSQAVRLFESIVDRYRQGRLDRLPLVAAAFQSLAELRFAAGDYARAGEAAQNTLDILDEVAATGGRVTADAPARAWLQLGRAQAAQGLATPARESLTRALESAPSQGALRNAIQNELQKAP